MRPKAFLYGLLSSYWVDRPMEPHLFQEKIKPIMFRGDQINITTKKAVPILGTDIESELVRLWLLQTQS